MRRSRIVAQPQAAFPVSADGATQRPPWEQSPLPGEGEGCPGCGEAGSAPLGSGSDGSGGKPPQAGGGLPTWRSEGDTQAS